nr:hypothetical protein Iba_chr13cCG12190 [Ipomoea batatas]
MRVLVGSPASRGNELNPWGRDVSLPAGYVVLEGPQSVSSLSWKFGNARSDNISQLSIGYGFRNKVIPGKTDFMQQYFAPMAHGAAQTILSVKGSIPLSH